MGTCSRPRLMMLPQRSTAYLERADTGQRRDQLDGDVLTGIGLVPTLLGALVLNARDLNFGRAVRAPEPSYEARSGVPEARGEAGVPADRARHDPAAGRPVRVVAVS